MTLSWVSRIARLGALSILAVACSARVDEAVATAASSAAASHGEAILKAQVDAVKNWSDPVRMAATFAPTAILLLPNGERSVADAEGDMIASGIAYLNPHATVTAASFDHFTAGGNAQVSWFTAELHFTVKSSEPGYGATPQQRTIRAVEVLEGASDKVVVAAFTSVGPLQELGMHTVRDATPAGPLANLLIAPESLAASLDAAAIVLGTDPAERGAGSEAKALLGKWKKLKLSLAAEQKLREVHTATYGYAISNVIMAPSKPGGAPQAMTAFVLALPGPSGSWSVVAASYGATY